MKEISIAAAEDAEPTQPPPEAAVFTHGRGIKLYRNDGAEFIDAVSGTFNLPLGYDDPDVVSAVADQLGRCAHLSSSLTHSYSKMVIQQLLDLAPSNLGAGWMRDITGSTANECAIKIAQKATGATDIISMFLSHHGQTQLTTGVSGNAFRRRDFPGTAQANAVHVPGPYCYRCFYRAKYPGCGFLCVERIADFIEYSSSGNIACLIIEPVFGNGGGIVPPPGYFEALQKLCHEQGILLIADEVQTGIGRTGYMFACETFNIQPSLMTLAKGLGGIGIPAAAVLMEDRVDVLASHDHSFTSGGNMLSLAAATATVAKVSSGDLLSNVRSNGMLLGELLTGLQERFACIGDVRGVGYMWGVEIVDADGAPDVRRTNAIAAAAFENQKLILRSSRYSLGNFIKVRPALVATADDLVEIVHRLAAALQQTE